jgi:hypothetical protein
VYIKATDFSGHPLRPDKITAIGGPGRRGIDNTRKCADNPGIGADGEVIIIIRENTINKRRRSC